MGPFLIGELTSQIINIVEWRDKEQFESAADKSDMWVLFMLDRGSFRYGVGKHRGIARSGEMVLCPPNITFERKIIQPLTFLAIYFDWYTKEKKLVRNEQDLLPNPAGKLVVTDSNRLSSNYEYLKKCNDRMDSVQSYRRNFLLQDIWQLYTWEWETTKQEKYTQPVDPLMRKAKDMLESRHSGFINIKSLANELGLSPVQFTRRFKASFGVTPIDYLTNVRLRTARNLLAETQLTLEQIASQCGYESGLYLSRVFSKKMNISPSQYRKAHRL